MPVAGGDGSAGKGGRKGGRSNAPILTLPPAAAPSAPPRGGGSASTPSTAPAAAVKGSTAATSATSAASSASADYAAAQRKRDMATRDRYLGDAAQMQGQIRALRHTLGPKGEFKDALKRRLRNVERLLGEQEADLDKQAAGRMASLDSDQLNNEIASADSTVAADSNRIRERTMALSEVAAQGGGESDALRAQLMSLRSGEANLNETNRAYHDGQRSINASRIDLATDTHNARVNMFTEAMADKEQLWTTFNNQVSETWTQLGNALGQQAEYYGLATEAARNANAAAKAEEKAKSESTTKTETTTKGGTKPGPKLANKGGEGNTGPGRDGGGRTRTPLGRPKAGSAAPQVGGLAQPSGSGAGYIPGKGGTRFDSTLGTPGKGGGGGGKGGMAKNEADASKQSDKAFMAAANAQGRAWRNPGLSKELQDWEAPVPEVKQLNSSLLQSARTTQAMTRPEGATLRKW